MEKKKKAVKKVPAAPKEKRDICFVIMPFGGWFDTYYKEIFCPAIMAAGLEPRRADDLYGPSNVVKDIWSYTKQAKLILADLTGRNPNVFYELGLAHGLPKPVILISEVIEDIPFDLQGIRYIRYDKNAYNWGADLSKAIEKSIKEIVKSPEDFIPAPFLESKSDDTGTKVTQHDKDLAEMKQEIELLKRRSPYPSSRPIQMTRSYHPTGQISQAEARVKIANYLRMDMPENMIMTRLVDRGAPASWVLDEIRRQKNPGDFDAG